METTKQEKRGFVNIGRLNISEGQFVLAIYVICVIIRFVTGAYMKHMETISDERVYRYLAETVAAGNAERLRALAGIFGYKRILYPLFVSPAFLIKGRYLQTIIYQLINSVLISSVIFPLSLLAKKVVLERRVRVVCYLVFLLLPELCQSVTFASENLYLPLATWAVLLFAKDHKKKDGNSGWQNLILGTMVYLLKLCKDAGMIIYFGASLYYMVEAFMYKDWRCRWIRAFRRVLDIVAIGCTYLTVRIVGQYSWLSVMEDKNKQPELKEFIIIAITLSIYLVMWIGSIIKLPERTLKIGAAVARGGGYSLIVLAGIATFKLLSIPGGWENGVCVVMKILIPETERYFTVNPGWYSIYAVYNIMYVMMAVLILPVVLPFMYPDCLNEHSHRLYRLTTCLCIIGTLFITFYINPFGVEEIPPRGIIRYLCFLWIPYMLCFASMYEKKSEAIDKKKMIAFISVMVAFLILFSGAKTGSSIDMDMLFYIVYHFTYVMWQLKVPLAVMGLIAIPLYHRKREWLFICFAAGLTLVWLLDNGLMLMDHHNRYGMSKEEYERIAVDDELIRENSDKKILVISEATGTEESSQLAKFRISFIEPYANVYSISLGAAMGCMDGTGRIILDSLAAACGIERYEYVMIQYDIPYTPEGLDVFPVDSTAGGYYRAWKIGAGTVISLTEPIL